MHVQEFSFHQFPLPKLPLNYFLSTVVAFVELTVADPDDQRDMAVVRLLN